jgi:hypothetical protein
MLKHIVKEKSKSQYFAKKLGGLFLPLPEDGKVPCDTLLRGQIPNLRSDVCSDAQIVIAKCLAYLGGDGQIYGGVLRELRALYVNLRVRYLLIAVHTNSILGVAYFRQIKLLFNVNVSNFLLLRNTAKWIIKCLSYFKITCPAVAGMSLMEGIACRSIPPESFSPLRLYLQRKN